jgi:hypothetical protein
MDSWAGYLEEREVIFQALWHVGGGIIVSGDRHEHGACSSLKSRDPDPLKNDSHGQISTSTEVSRVTYHHRILHVSTLILLPTVSSGIRLA